MGMGQELKEFAASFQSGWKLMEDSEYKKALAEYYRNGKGKGGSGALARYGNSGNSSSGGFLGRIFGGSDDKEGSDDPWTTGANNILAARQNAARAGDGAALDELAKQAKAFARHAPNQGNAVDTNDDDDDDEVETDARGGLVGSRIHTYDEGGPVEAVPVTPEVTQQQEQNDGEADREFSRRLSEFAQPGVAAGLKYMQANLNSGEAVPMGGDEERVKSLANNDGAASTKEVDTLLSIIDPERKLPEHLRPAALIGAVTERYKDDPETAAKLNNSLLLHFKQNAQTRGALALEALSQGNFSASLKMLQDANNKDMPTDTLITNAVATSDDTAKVTIETADGKTQDIEATKPQVIAMAKSVATGQTPMQALIDFAAKAPAEKGKGKGGGGGKAAKAPAINTELTGALAELKTAADRVRALPEGTDEADREKLMGAVERAEAKARAIGISGKNAAWVEQTRNDLINKAKTGIGGTGKEPTADDKVASVDRRARLDAEAGVNSDTREALPVSPSGMRSEGGTVARASREAVDSLSTGNLGARKADIRAEGTADREFKQSKEYDPLEEVSATVKGSPMLSRRAVGRDLSVLENIGVSLAQKNNLTKEQVKNLLEDVADPRVSMRYDSKGRVQIGDNRPVVLDGATARQLQAVKAKMAERVIKPPADILKGAEDAIKRGANRDDVIDRLIRNGYSVTGL